MDSHLYEKKAKLVTTRKELSCLPPQINFRPVARNQDFAYGYGAGALRLRSHLLTNPSANLTHLDLNLLKPDAASRHFVDAFGRKEMSDAFKDIPTSPPPSGGDNA